jgi:hypothetical protein
MSGWLDLAISETSKDTKYEYEYIALKLIAGLIRSSYIKGLKRYEYKYKLNLSFKIVETGWLDLAISKAPKDMSLT